MLLIPMRPQQRFGSLSYEVYDGAAAQNALTGYLLRSPYANVEALAALGRAHEQDAKVNGIGFYRDREMVAAMVATRENNYVSHMVPDVQAEWIDFMEQVYIGQSVSEQRGASLHMLMPSQQAGSIKEGWNAAAGRRVTVHHQTERQYIFYSDLVAPTLPPSRFDGHIKPANDDVKQLVLSNMSGMSPQEIKALPPENVQAASALLMQQGLHAVHGKGLINVSAFYVQPISESGLLVSQSILALNRDEVVDLPQAELNAGLRDELQDQFAAIARMADEQRRWVMFSMPANGKLPVAQVARRLELMEAGQLDCVVLGVKPKAAAATPAA